MTTNYEFLHLSEFEIDEISERIDSNNLTDKDKEILIGLISLSFNLEDQLLSANTTITKLRKMFGIKTEKKRIPIAGLL